MKTFLDKEMSALAFRGQGDFCLSFFAVAYEAGWFTFPPKAKILEIGCAEGDWQTPMLTVRPDVQITGIDWRAVDRPGVVLRGDVMTHELPEGFDAIVSISAIEHIGLGGYEDTPLDDEGDIKTMQRAHTCLAPGGWMYLDVPYQAHGPMVTLGGSCPYRRYNDDAIRERLCQGLFTIEKRAQCIVEHPDSPYMALLLRKV